MNILIWNIRGMRTSLPRLQQLLRDHLINLLALIEPKHTPAQVHRFCLRLGFSHCYASQSEHIWFFWRDNEFRMLATQDQEQVIHLTLSSVTQQHSFVLSLVYAKHTATQRQHLWRVLCDFSTGLQLPWLIGGDFNTFRAIDDHNGRSTPSLSALQDFNDCIEVCSLMSPPYQGTRYTWDEGRGLGRVRQRLDWTFINSLMYDMFDTLRLTHLPRVTSDHTPLLIQCQLSTQPIRRSFRFLDAWLHHPDFHNYVRHAWLSYPTTGGMRGFYDKLFSLKKDIQQWNKAIFGNIFSKFKDAENNLNTAENN